MSTAQKALFVCVAIAIGVLGSFAYIQLTANQEGKSDDEPDFVAFANDYKNVTPDNPFVYASDQQILDIFDKGTGLVYLGFPQCPWCQELVGMIDQAAYTEQLDQVYYLNIKQARASSSDTYQQLVTTLKPYLDKNDDGEPTIYVPDVTAVKDGKIIGRFEMEKAPAAQSKSADTYWTDQRRARAVEQLQTLIQQLKAE